MTDSSATPADRASGLLWLWLCSGGLRPGRSIISLRCPRLLPRRFRRPLLRPNCPLCRRSIRLFCPRPCSRPSPRAMKSCWGRSCQWTFPRPQTSRPRRNMTRSSVATLFTRAWATAISPPPSCSHRRNTTTGRCAAPCRNITTNETLKP